MFELDRGGGPKPQAGPDIWVRRVDAEETIDFACASPVPWEFWIHWDGPNRKSMPCQKDHSKCPGCLLPLPRKWRGYLYGLNHNTRKMEYLEVTLKGSEQLFELIGHGLSLRGQRFRVARGKAKTAHCRFTLLRTWEDFSPNVKIPQDIDPEKTLLTLWLGPDHPALAKFQKPRLKLG